MRKLLIDVERPAALEATRDLRHLLTRVCEAGGIPEDVSGRMTLAVAESLTNVVEHSTPAATSMGLKLEQDDETWIIRVTDDGGAWSADSAAAGAPDDESGRGLGIVESVCDHVQYSRDEALGSNQVAMSWHAAAALERISIMVVEDDATQRALYEAYLKPHYDVTVVDSGDAALRAFDLAKPDLVVSDLKMPGMDGLSFRERLVEKRDGALTAFIVLTGNEDQVLAQRAISLGVDDYLLKPVNGAQLRQAVERVLNRMRQIRERLGQRIAARITSSLVPELPVELPGWQHALAVRDTGAGGGDLLLHKMDGDCVHLLLVDIMGHDETAKFFAHACAGYLRGLLHGLNALARPADVLEALSEAALQDALMAQTLFTCVAVTLRPGGQVEFAIAGHPPPLIACAGELVEAGEAEMVPGLQAGISYTNHTLQLQAGEKLVLYTDGLFENAATTDEREALTVAVRQALASASNAPPSRALREAMQHFDALAAEPLRDDTLLLLLEPA